MLARLAVVLVVVGFGADPMRSPVNAGRRPRRRRGTRSSRGSSGATTSAARRSTSSRCGRPTRSTPRRSTASWLGRRRWASTACASSCTTCVRAGPRRLPKAHGWVPGDRRAAQDRRMLVPFDGCWDPNPKLGKQPTPKPGLHNSGWVQSPGAADLLDTNDTRCWRRTSTRVVGRFKDDKRVEVWDIWNEPDNTTTTATARTS